MADKTPTQGMDPSDGHKGEPDGTGLPLSKGGGEDGGPSGDARPEGFHGGQSGAAYHGHGQLGTTEVEGEDNDNGVSQDP